MKKTVYLDFNGGRTSYNGELLTVDEVSVENPRLSMGRIALIVQALNEYFAGQEVGFVTVPPTGEEYSTVFVGKTDAFSFCGIRLGLAEAIGRGNAFVLLDSSSSNEFLVEIIAHETGHILGATHAGAGLLAYAADQETPSQIVTTLDDILNPYDGLISLREAMTVYATGAIVQLNATASPETYDIKSNLQQYNGNLTISGTGTETILSTNGSILSVGGTSAKQTLTMGNVTLDIATNVNDGGTLWLSQKAKASNVQVNSGGTLFIHSGTSAVNTVVNNGGFQDVSWSGTALGGTVNSGGTQQIMGGYVSGTVINAGGYQQIVYGNAIDCSVYGLQEVRGEAGISGYASNATIHAGGTQLITSNGIARGTVVESDGHVSIYHGVLSGGVIDIGGYLEIGMVTSEEVGYANDTYVAGTVVFDDSFSAAKDIWVDGSITFGIDRRTVTDGAIGFNLKYAGSYNFSIKVGTTQTGLYRVAEGVGDFTSRIMSIVKDGTADLTGLSVDGGIYYSTDGSGQRYMLYTKDDVLYASISTGAVYVNLKEDRDSGTGNGNSISLREAFRITDADTYGDGQWVFIDFNLAPVGARAAYYTVSIDLGDITLTNNYYVLVGNGTSGSNIVGNTGRIQVNGGQELVVGNGIILTNALTVNAGGLVNLRNNAQTDGAILAGGTMTMIGQAATALNTVVSNGGYLVVADNSLASDTVVSSGGHAMVQDSAYGMTVQAGGTLTTQKGETRNVTIEYGGRWVMSSLSDESGYLYWGEHTGALVAGTLEVTSATSTDGVSGSGDITFAIDQRTVNDDFMVTGIGYLAGTSFSYGIQVGASQRGTYRLAADADYNYVYSTRPYFRLLVDGVEAGYLDVGRVFRDAAFQYQYAVSWRDNALYVDIFSSFAITLPYDRNTLGADSDYSLREALQVTDSAYFGIDGAVMAYFDLPSGEERVTITDGNITMVHSAYYLYADGSPVEIIGGEGNRIVVGDGQTLSLNNVTVSNALIIGSGGVNYIGQGTVSGTIIDGGTQILNTDALSHDAQVNDGGVQIVMANGYIFDTTVNSGGTVIGSGSASINSTTVNSGGSLINHAANIFELVVNSGGYLGLNAEASYDGPTYGYLWDVKVGGTVEFIGSGTFNGEITLLVNQRTTADDFMVIGMDYSMKFIVEVDPSQIGRYAIAANVDISNIEDGSPFPFHTLGIDGSAYGAYGFNEIITPDPSVSPYKYVYTYEDGNIYLRIFSELIVTVATDRNNSTIVPSSCSLREAFRVDDMAYQGVNGAIMVGFDVIGSEIDITRGPLNMTADAYYLNGQGIAITIWGGDRNRIEVGDGKTLYIDGLVMKNAVVVRAGGTAYQFGNAESLGTVIDGGAMYASSAIVSKAQVGGDGGRLVLNSDAVSEQTVVNSGGTMFVSESAVANYTTVNSGGYMEVSQRGEGSVTTVNSGGLLAVKDSGTLNSGFINSGGSMVISAGGDVYGAFLVGGEITVEGLSDSECSLFLDIRDRNYTDSYIVNNLDNIHVELSLIVDSKSYGTYLLASSAWNYIDGSLTNGLTVYGGYSNDGYGVDVLGTFTTQNMSFTDSAGRRFTLNIDASNNLSVTISGHEPPSNVITIADGNRVDAWDFEYSLEEVLSVYPTQHTLGSQITFDSNLDGTPVVFSRNITPTHYVSQTMSGNENWVLELIGNGVNRTQVIGESGAKILVSSTALVLSKLTLSGGAYVESGTLLVHGANVYDTVVDSGGTMNLLSGAMIFDTLIQNSGTATLAGSSVAENTTILTGGYMSLINGEVQSTFISSANLYVGSAGMATDTVVSGGGLTISRGSAVNVDAFDASVYIASYGSAANVNLSNGILSVGRGGLVSNLDMTGNGSMSLMGSARGVEIHSGVSGTMHEGSVANDMYLYSGSYISTYSYMGRGQHFASNLTVEYGAALELQGTLYAGGTATFGGTIILNKEGMGTSSYAINGSGGTIVFDLTERSPWQDDALFDRFDSVTNYSEYHVSVTGSQSKYRYMLAGGAGNFVREGNSITLIVDGAAVGTVELNKGYLDYNGVRYSFGSVGNTLNIGVGYEAASLTVSTNSDVTSETDFAISLRETLNTYLPEYYWTYYTAYWQTKNIVIGFDESTNGSEILFDGDLEFRQFTPPYNSVYKQVYIGRYFEQNMSGNGRDNTIINSTDGGRMIITGSSSQTPGVFAINHSMTDLTVRNGIDLSVGSLTATRASLNDVNVQSSATLILKDAEATDVQVTGSSLVVISAGTVVSGLTVSTGFIQGKSGTIIDATLEDGVGGMIYGEVSGLVLSSGASFTAAIGYDSGTVINSGGTHFVMDGILSGIPGSGGITEGAVVENGGSQFILTGSALGETIESGGKVSIVGGGMSDTVINSGGLLEGGMVTDENFIDLGYTSISMTGTTVIGGTLKTEGYQLSMLEIMNLMNASYGSSTSQADIDLYKDQYLETASLLVDAGGGTFVLAVDQRNTADDVMIDNIANVTNVGQYNITVKADQEAGTYLLAGGASLFTQGMTVYVGADALGVNLTVNGGFVARTGNQYALVQAGGVLSLTVRSAIYIVDTDQDLVADDGLNSLREGLELNDSNYLSGGSIMIGFDSGTDVSNGGNIVISSGSMSQNFSNTLLSGNGADETIVSGSQDGGRIIVEDGETLILKDITILDGLVISSGGTNAVSSGGVTSGAIVESSGGQLVSSGGSADGTEINSGGSQIISSGGTATDTVVSSGGSLTLEDGGTIGGDLDGGGEVTIGDGVLTDKLNVYFNITERTPANGYIYHNLDGLADVLGYYVVVKTGQGNGEYKLADGAANFATFVTLIVDGVDTGVVISIGESRNYGETQYTLLSDGSGNLTFTVFALEPPNTVVNIAGDIVNPIDFDYSLREAVEVYAPLKLVDGTAYVTFNMKAGEGNTILLADDITLKVNTSIDGGGTISVTGGVIYGNANEMTLKDITLTSGNVIGGLLNGDTTGNTVLTVDNVTVSTAALIMGGTMANDGSSYNHTGNISVILDGIQLRSNNRVYAAGSVSNGSHFRINGDVSLHIVDINVDTNARRIYAAGQVQGNSEMWINGNISLTVDATSSIPHLFAGGAVLDAGSSLIINGTVTTTINGGNFLGTVGNGSQSLGTTSQKASTLTINGGTFSSLVYAGAYSQGGVVSVSGDSTMVINGGTFNSYVIGGCGASAYNNVNGNQTIVNGSTSITVNATQDIYFNSNIYCGSAGNGVITGNTAITFTGDGANLHFSATGRVIGDSCTAGPKKNYITGSRYVTFDGFTGNFEAALLGFDVFTVKGNSSVIYKSSTADGQVADISNWRIESNSSNAMVGALIWDATDSNSFAGDTFELSFASSLASALVYDGNNAGSIAGWGSNMTVRFVIDNTSYNCSWNSAENGWTATAAGSTWLLAADTVDNDLKLSKLA